MHCEPNGLVRFLASVNDTGRSSMEIGIRVTTENITERTQRHANSCYFTMVAKDSDGSTAEVPPLILESEEDVRRFCSALQRRRIRDEGVAFMTDYKSSFTDHYAVADLLSEERCVLSMRDS